MKLYFSQTFFSLFTASSLPSRPQVREVSVQTSGYLAHTHTHRENHLAIKGCQRAKGTRVSSHHFH